MSSEVAIKVSNLGKCYQIYDKPSDRLKQMLMRGRRKYYRDFWALKGVSFDVRKGETIGVVGRNGSGKSTLLQMICGTLNPTEGSVSTHGRIAALLELGSGFNPEFTGRENVFLNAALLGLRPPEIERRFDDIVAFSDIGQFIDQPVKTYSSGMVVRLAFAVIAHVDADILVVDEALSVGDVFFSQKCMRFFEGFQSSGGTVFFVSHDTAAVMNLCQHAILLAQGSVRQIGPADLVCKTYLEDLYSDRASSMPGNVAPQATEALNPGPAVGKVLEFVAPRQSPNKIIVSPFNAQSASFGIGGAKIIDAGFFDANGNRLSELTSETAVRFSITVTSDRAISFPAVGLIIKDRLGQAVVTEGTTWAFEGQYGAGKLEFLPGDFVRVDFAHKVPLLFDGEYAVSVAVAEGYGHEHVQHHFIHEALILRSTGNRLVHGLTGMADLQVSISVSRGTAELASKRRNS